MATTPRPPDIYLKDSTNPDNWLRLPVLPEEFNVSSEKQIETYNIIDLGEADFPTGDKRAEISFSSFFPVLYDPSYCRYGLESKLLTPQSIVEWILDLQSRGKPIRLIITESPVNTLTLLSQFKYRSKGGEPGDIYYDMTFRAWVDIGVRLKERTKTTARTRADLKAVPKTIIKKGTPEDAETYLAKVAKIELGDMALWRQLLNLNLPMIAKNAYKIIPYAKLVMPS